MVLSDLLQSIRVVGKRNKESFEHNIYYFGLALRDTESRSCYLLIYILYFQTNCNSIDSMKREKHNHLLP